MELSSNRDPYARLGLANINYLLSVMHRTELTFQEGQLQSAMGKYFSLLELDECNSYGSLGIANVLAEYGKVREAKEIFALLANSEADQLIGMNALINQAHLCMAEKSYDLAINLYKEFLIKNPNNIEIAMYLSKAYFRKQNFEVCKQMTVNLLAKHPNDMRLKYNLAFCLYQEASQIFNLKQRKVS